MRFLENVILILLLLSLAWTFLPPQRRSRIILYLPFLTSLLLIIHIVMEGARWQMFPAYLLALGLLVNNTRLLRSTNGHATRQPVWLRLLAVFAGLLVFIVVSQLPVLIPVFSLPQPTGGFDVGISHLVLTDEMRPETFTSQTDDFRQIPLMIWYPAEIPVNARPVTYWLDQPEISRQLTGMLKLPFFLLDHLALVRTHAVQDAPAAQGQPPFPVILFSHGYRLGYLQQNTSLMETLASHGYVVISIGHPYQAAAVPDAKGNLIRFAVETAPRFSQDASFREESLTIWTDDLRFVLNHLADFQQGDLLPQLAGRLNLDRIGVAGMSFGGSAASRLCLHETRCEALLTLDSPQYEPVLSQPLQQPALFFAAQESEYVRSEVYEKINAPAYLITIQGSAHYDFTDLTLVSPLNAALGFSGGINGEQMVRILNQYSLAFFDRHLKDLPAPLLDNRPADYPEVTITARNWP
ncbi:MAG: carboxylic ester hydrolase [Bellilinea sp.]|nr:MAG: carboxylic ester hydrolase [Bellilinea sp.]